MVVCFSQNTPLTTTGLLSEHGVRNTSATNTERTGTISVLVKFNIRLIVSPLFSPDKHPDSANSGDYSAIESTDSRIRTADKYLTGRQWFDGIKTLMLADATKNVNMFF